MLLWTPRSALFARTRLECAQTSPQPARCAKDLNRFRGVLHVSAHSMPTATRSARARDNDSTEQAGTGEAVATPAEAAGGGQAPAAAPEDARTTPGRRARTPASASRLVERARAHAESRAGGAGITTSCTFSQEQLAAIAAIVKSAVGEATALSSSVAAESHAPAGAPAVEVGVAATGENDATNHTAGRTNTVPGDDRLDEYVPDLGVDNPHARAVFTGGDTYSRPQRYNMHRDSTFDALKSKPKGTLFKEYCTLEPSLRYLFNVKSYVKDLTAEVESGSITADEFVLHTERVFNSVSGVYDLLNRHVGLIHLRAQYGDNPTAREKAKLEHIEDVLTEEDFLPASLDDRIRDIAREFDDSFDSAKKTALAKKAAGSGGGGKGGDGEEPKESRRERAKRLEKERKAGEAKKAESAKPK